MRREKERGLMGMALPLMASMVVQGAYNVADSAFVSMYSPVALAAVTYALPVQLLMIALATGSEAGIIAIGLPASAAFICSNSVLQSLGREATSVALSAARLLLAAPMLAIGAVTAFGLVGIWWALAIADIASCVAALILVVRALPSIGAGGL